MSLINHGVSSITPWSHRTVRLLVNCLKDAAGDGDEEMGRQTEEACQATDLGRSVGKHGRLPRPKGLLAMNSVGSGNSQVQA